MPNKPNQAAFPDAGECASTTFVLSIARDKWRKKEFLKALLKCKVLFDNQTASLLNRKKMYSSQYSLCNQNIFAFRHPEMPIKLIKEFIKLIKELIKMEWH